MTYEKWFKEYKHAITGAAFCCDAEGVKDLTESAYEAGVKSQQNRIIELEEIISGREELQRGSI
jgi:hypothetical protein